MSGALERRQTESASAARSQFARSARRGSLENTSTIGICRPRRRWITRMSFSWFHSMQRHGDAALAGARGAAGAVEVRLVVLGRVVVHDDVDAVDVDAAGGDVGGDEHRHLAGR